MSIYQGIFSRFLSEGGALKSLLGKKDQMPGMYLGDKAPEDAPLPLVLFFNPTGGTTEISMPRTRVTTLEKEDVQFSIFAKTITEVENIRRALWDLYDGWTGGLGPDEAPTGAVTNSLRRGPGRIIPDPSGVCYNGYVEYQFTYWVK